MLHSCPDRAKGQLLTSQGICGRATQEKIASGGGIRFFEVKKIKDNAFIFICLNLVLRFARVARKKSQSVIEIQKCHNRAGTGDFSRRPCCLKGEGENDNKKRGDGLVAKRQAGIIIKDGRTENRTIADGHKRTNERAIVKTKVAGRSHN